MRAIVFCAALTLLGGAKPSTELAAGAKPQAKANERSAPSLVPKEPWLSPLFGRPDAVSPAPRASSSTSCTAVVVRADPRVDADMAQTVTGPVDSGIVVESPCRK